MNASPPGFLDVHELLDRSRPRVRAGWFKYAAGIFLLVVLVSAYLSSVSPMMESVVRLFSYGLFLGALLAMMAFSAAAVRAQKMEQQRVEAIEELVQLRRWPEAATETQQLLSTPARSPILRQQALFYLAAILARYHRFDDAITVQNHLLESDRLDPGTDYALRLGRAMAMLREDHLVDANQAISELRRLTPAGDSAGLALIDIYRDVKTGHPEEAIAIFDEKLPALRQQLGHRVADAYLLVARAHDMLDHAAEAQRMYERATLLAPPDELHRRYPETQTLASRYTPSSAPAEVA